MRPIDADALFEVIKKSMAENPHKEETQRAMHIHEHKYFLTLLTSFPTIQPETAKRIVGKERDGMTLWYQCDMCNEPVDEQDNYCRGCGRRLIDG